MELRQLLQFVTIAETGNFHRAAERLNISQPPLTVGIRKLEKELGARLFDRGTRGVTLTAAGEAAIDFARAALLQAEHVRRAAREAHLGERGSLSIGFVGSATFALIPRLIPFFRERYPRIELTLEESTSVDIVRRIHSRTYDLGLVRLPLLEASALDSHIVERDELIAALPAEHALARRRKLPLEALSGEPFITFPQVSVLRATIMLACHEAGFVPRIAQEAAQLHTILSLVRAGLGVALVPAIAARATPDDVRLVPLARSAPVQTGLVMPTANLSAPARHFTAMARATADS
jgi:DNA-binding transcriptional LysR family regulator